MISRRGFLKSIIAAPLVAYLPPIDHFVPVVLVNPVVAPGTTVITLGDGSRISLADWIDDKHYETIQLDKRNFGGGIEPFVARRT